jgi:hypothetical protein
MGVTQGQETACLLPQTHRARKETAAASFKR